MLLALVNDGKPVVGITLSSEALASDVLESAIRVARNLDP